MTTTTVQIEKLVAWSEPKRVETKMGPRNLRKAPTTQTFWDAWRSDKETLKRAGVSCGKSQDGEWEACWWLPLSAEETERIEQAQAASRATDADVELPCPEGLSYLPFQKAGIAYALDRPNVLIGDEMGLGKTIQAIGVWNSDPNLKKVLVICPASLRLNWQREFAKWSVRPVRIAVVNGGKATDWPSGDFDVLIVNYDVLEKHRERIDNVAFDLLVGDEIHLCKNGKAKRTQAVFGSKKKDGTWTKRPIPARRKVFLTGTPIVNRPIELWTLVESLDPQGLGRNFFSFAKRYTRAQQTRYGWDFSGADRLDELQRKLREKVLVRRLKADVLKELPAKRRQVIVLPANGASAEIRDEQAAVAAKEERMLELRTAVELAKCSDDPQDYADAVQALKDGATAAFTEMAVARHKVAVAKVPYVVEHLEASLEEGPVVCFAHHRDVIASIANSFPGQCVTLTGETSMEDRQKAVDDFQAGKIDLFLGNIQAAGVGITLTRSSHVIFAELDWVPGNLTQAEDRCHRIGQQEHVLVQHIVLEGSLDATMAQTVVAKQEVINGALDNRWAEPTFAEPLIERPTTVEIKVEEVRRQAIDISAEQIEAVHLGLQMLAGVCDGAAKRDDCGFNKMDAGIGRSLAVQPSLSPKQAALGRRLIAKYHRQIGWELIERAGYQRKNQEN